MYLSTKSKYAVLAMLELALQYDNGLVSVTALSEKRHIPAPFLGQLLLKLKRAGLAASRRGPEGGYSLALPPEAIQVGDILKIIESRRATKKPQGISEQPLARLICLEIEAKMIEALNSITLQDLCLKAREFEKPIPPSNAMFAI